MQQSKIEMHFTTIHKSLATSWQSPSNHSPFRVPIQAVNKNFIYNLQTKLYNISICKCVSYSSCFKCFQVPLVEQHYKAEFGKFLQHKYSVKRVSGASQLKISFPQIVEQNDIIICTAQILENSLAKGKNGDEDGIKLSRTLHFPLTDLRDLLQAVQAVSPSARNGNETKAFPRRFQVTVFFPVSLRRQVRLSCESVWHRSPQGGIPRRGICCLLFLSPVWLLHPFLFWSTGHTSERFSGSSNSAEICCQCVRVSGAKQAAPLMSDL